MGSIYRSLATYSPLIYIVLTIMGLYAFRRMWRTWREWRDAVYSLEREFALNRLGRATAFGLLVLLLFFAEFYVVTFIVPSLPASDIMVTQHWIFLLRWDTRPMVSFRLNTAAQSGMSGCVRRDHATSPKPGGDQAHSRIEVLLTFPTGFINLSLKWNKHLTTIRWC
jgi:hypothetical protein